MPALYANRSARVSKSSAASARNGRRLAHAACETLENRRMLCMSHQPDPGYTGASEAPQYVAPARDGGPEVDIGGLLWANRGTSTNDSDNFNATYGAQAANARNVVQAAFDAWRRVIPSFNQSGGNNQLDVTVTAAGRGVDGTGGSAGVDTLLGDKPRTSSISLGGGSDVNGINGVEDAEGFWLDPTPYDNKEFMGTIVNAFTGDAQTGSPAQGKSDFFSLVTIEIQHALGIEDRYTNLRWRSDPNDYLRPAGTSHTNAANDTSESVGKLYYLNSPNAQALFTSFNSGNGGEDRGYAVHSAPPGQTYTTGGVTYNGQLDTGAARYQEGRRFMPSRVGVMALGDMYGYTVTAPESFGTFYGVVDPASRVLTVRGGTNSASLPSGDRIEVRSISQGVSITYDIGQDVAGTNMGGQFVSSYDRSEVSSIVINSGDGSDTIRIEGNDGMTTSVNSEAGDDFIDFSFYERNLTAISANTNVSGGAGSDQIYTYDNNSTIARTFNVTSSRFDRVNWGGFFYSADVEFENLTTGTGADTVNVLTTFANQPVFIFSAGGADTVNIGNSTNGVRGINADVTVYNDPSLTTLNINNGPDTGARTWNVDAVDELGYLVGMAPARIYWDNADISSINLTCGSGVDTGKFVISTETFNVNNSGANDFITIGAPAAQGLQLISGQITIDNAPAITALSIDDTGSSIARTLTIDEGGGYNTVVGFGPLIRFDNADTNTTIITGSASDTVNVPRNDDTLTINSSGGNDVVNLGNTTNGVQSIVGALTVRNAPSTSTVNINNGPDTTARTTLLQNVAVGADILGQWTGLAPATISYRYLDVSAVNVTFGSAADSVLIRQTQKDLNLSTTGGIDAYAIGGSSNGAQSVLGNITLLNPPNHNNIHVDNTGDTFDSTAFLDDVTISGSPYGQLTGLAPATISWKHADTTGVTVTGGGGADRFFVDEYKGAVALSILGGNGNDEVHFGGGNLAANIISTPSFNFDGQGGSADKFVISNIFAPASESWNYGVDGPGLTASRIVGGVHNFSLGKQNVEQSVIHADQSDGNLVITAVPAGQSFTFNGGDGGEAVFLPFNLSTAIAGKITLDGQGGPNNTISQTTNTSTAATTLHVTANTIGAAVGDNFFAPGGSVQFSNMNSIVLTLGTGADTLYAAPNATATLNIRAGNPTTAPGDRLNLGLANVTGSSVNGTPANGSVTSSNRQTLTYSFFETGPTIDSVAPTPLSGTAQHNLPRQQTRFTFSENVGASITPEHAVIYHLDTETPVPDSFKSLAYDSGANAAVVTYPGYFNGALPDGNYLATLTPGYADFFGNAPTQSFGVSFFVFAGDANHDRSIDIGDFSALASNFNSAGSFSAGDFDYSGMVEIGDFAILASKFNTSLPQSGGLPRTADASAVRARDFTASSRRLVSMLGSSSFSERLIDPETDNLL